MKNKFYSFYLKTFLLFSAIVFSTLQKQNSFAGLTEPDNLSKGAKLGLSLAEAIAEQKDVQEGLKKVAKDQLDDWMWDSLGGYEKLWTGQLEGEAYIKQGKDKIKKILEITQSIADFSAKLGEGKYDEALFVAIDNAVGAVDHPVVKVMWQAVKLTYESHKMVKDTQAELEIETLYGIVNNDRRLIGTLDPKSDQPKLIPENAGTADYFFEKYLITDDRVRGLVKTYVTKVLNDEWPEQTWSEWLASWQALGSGVDSKRSAEIEALDTQWRNKARGWIMQLIKDLNKQVKLAWAQARMRQEMAEFQRFAERLGMFEKNIDRIISEFKDKQKYRQELPTYQQYLADSPGARQKVLKDLEDPKKTKSLKDIVGDWKAKLLYSSSAAYLIGEEKLSTALKEELSQWYKIEEKFKQEVADFSREVSADPGPLYIKPGEYPLVSRYWGDENTIVEEVVCTYEDVLENYRKNFAAYIKPFEDWDITIKDAKNKLLDLLNQGDFAEAEKLKERWAKQKEKIDLFYNEIREGLEKKIQQEKDKALEFWQTHAGKKGYGREIGRVYWSFQGAQSMARKALEDMLWTSNELYRSGLSELEEIYSAFSGLKNSLAQLWQPYISLVDRVKERLPISDITGQKVDMNKPYSKSSYQFSANYISPKQIKETIDSFKNNLHTRLPPFTSGEDIYGLPSRMKALAAGLRQGIWSSSALTQYLQDCEQAFKTWKDAAKEWKEAAKLDQEQLNQIEVLLRPDVDFNKLRKEIGLINQAAEALPNLVSSLTAKLNEFKQQADTDAANRLKDAQWLTEKVAQVEKFFNEQEKNGVFRKGQSDYELAVDLGQENMAISYAPFKRYMTEDDIRQFSNRLRSSWENYPGYQFIKQYAPKVYQKLNTLLSLPAAKRAPEENFIPYFYQDRAIWKSSLAKAKAILKKMKPDLEESEFKRKMNELNELVPGLFIADDKYLASFRPLENNIEGVQERFDFPLGKEYVALYFEIKDLLQERLGYVRELRDKKDLQKQQEEARLMQEKLRKESEQAGKELAKKQAGGLAAFYGYAILNPRLNTLSLQSARGVVTLTSDDLDKEYLQITGRLTTLDRVDKLLISEDGGLSWQELGRSQDISYSFTPLAGKMYNPVLKIKTIDFEDIQIKFFNNIDGIIFANISYSDMVLRTLKDIAEAYEAQNLSLFRDYISRDYLGNKVFLEEGIRLDFDLFTNIRLAIYVNRLEKRGDLFIAETKWDKTQTVRKTAQEQKTSGNTTFVFCLEDGRMKIKNLRGNLIYATLSPEIAQSSGLSSKVVEQIRQAQQERNPIQPGAGEVEDAGGSGSDGSAGILSVTYSPALTVPGFPGIGFDFSANAEVPAESANSDVDFESNIFFPYQFQEVSQSFNAIDEAPSSGYSSTATLTEAGKVFVFITKEGYYGKMEILTFTDLGGGVFSLTFKFALQTDGSRNLRTQ